VEDAVAVVVGVVVVRAVVVPAVRALAARRRRRCVVVVLSVVVAAGARFSRASRLATGSATVSRAITWAANPSPVAKTRPSSATTAILMETRLDAAG
jgi:hypothetical protein